MTPPDHKPDPATRWFRRTTITAICSLTGCGTAWLLFGAWACWTEPDALGPGRLITALALVVATAASCVVLWQAATGRVLWQEISRLILEQATRDAIANLETRSSHRPTAIDSRRR